MSECDVCQTTKHETLYPAGLLQPLLVPALPWTNISIDFIQGLPLSYGSNVIFLFVIDRVTKHSHFFTLGHPYTLVIVAQVFFSRVFKLYGMPKSIVSNRDPISRSSFSKELF